MRRHNQSHVAAIGIQDHECCRHRTSHRRNEECRPKPPSDHPDRLTCRKTLNQSCGQLVRSAHSAAHVPFDRLRAHLCLGFLMCPEPVEGHDCTLRRAQRSYGARPSTSAALSLSKGSRRIPASVGLLGQVVGQVDGRLDGLVHAEPMFQDQPREIAGIDATEEVVASGNGRECPGVVHKA